MRRIILILVLMALTTVNGCHSSLSGANPLNPSNVHLPPRPAAQTAWAIAEVIAVAMMSLGAVLAVLALFDGTGVKGPISMLAGGSVLLILSLTMSRFEKELEWIGAFLFLACFGFACWEFWEHRKQIAQELQASKNATT